MITVSEGDQSEYEAHFAQGIGKEDKARKQATRTPENTGKTADKIGKKQRKQLQFNALGEPSRSGEHPQGALGDASITDNATQPETSPTRKLKGSSGDQAAGGSLAPTPSVKGDKQRGKDSAVGPSTGK
ncbi:unnamed protein product [Calypogeia fissa]